jgi:hypothetical protein
VRRAAWLVERPTRQGVVQAVAIGYMLSRGLAKSGTKHVGGDEQLTRTDR